jgi:hypothetical protein
MMPRVDGIISPSSEVVKESYSGIYSLFRADSPVSHMLLRPWSLVGRTRRCPCQIPGVVPHTGAGESVSGWGHNITVKARESQRRVR